MVRPQLPIALDPASEPEPDVCVVRGEPRDYLRSHPSRPVLIVEVAESGLNIARMVKARLYARAGIREYWIVDLKGRALEVYRRPTGRARVPRYRSVRRLGPRESIAPLAAPRCRVRVASLLP
jgi:Uma2 family endonuclease